MLSIHRVLFPTDFSEGAKRAFPQAASFADQHDAGLHILNVKGRHQRNGETANPQFPIPLDTLTEWLRRSASSGSGSNVPDLEALSITQEQVESTDPGEQIPAYIENEEIDLTVMGTHGRRGVDRIISGSVTEEVVRKAPSPVLTVQADADVAPNQAVRRILAPVDFSDASDVAVQHAKEIALTYGAEIDLLHVVEAPFYPPAYGLEPTNFPTEEVIENVEQRLGDMAREDIGYEHVMIETKTGNPAVEILDYVENNEVDLVVIATHGRTGLKRMLIGSVAELVLRRCPTPVFVVKPNRKSLVPS